MVKCVVLDKTGGPESLIIKDIKIGAPGADEVRIKQKAIGLNFVDTYFRKGSYPVALPAIIGCEACGVVEEVGANVKEFQKGDRVAYATTMGAYAEERIINKDYLVPVPDYVSDEEAAALLLKAMTAHYLLRRTFFVTPKNTILTHEAAGGAGQMICMLAKHYGAKVIATVGSDEKKKVVESIGVDKVINYKAEDFALAVKEYTKGEGVHVVYDSVGKDTFDKSLECLGDFGLMVSFGSASGEVPDFKLSRLTEKSLFITKPSLFSYKKFRVELLLSANEVFSLIQQKILKAHIFKKYKLSEIQEAHKDLESRKTIGQSVILV